jgi:hypothetical protein
MQQINPNKEIFPNPIGLLTKKGLTMETYNRNETIHKRGVVDVEVDLKGKVVGVWFNCMALPFTHQFVDYARAKELREMYKEQNERDIKIEAITFNHF